MNEIELIGFSEPRINLAPNFLTLKEGVLLASKKITEVASAPAKELACEILVEIKSLLKGLESSRVEVKKPALAIGKKIDVIAKTAAGGLEEESLRLSRLVGSYEAEERRLVAEAEAARQAENSKLVEKMVSGTPQEKQAAEEAIRLSMPIVPEKTSGLRMFRDGKFEVTCLQVAFQSRPELFEIVPIASRCKDAALRGEKIEGMKLWIEERLV